VEDYGVRALLQHFLGYTSGFKSVLILQDLSNGYRTCNLGNKLNEESSIIAAKKLAQLHSIFWNKTNTLPIPKEYIGTNAYNLFFNLDSNWFSKIRLDKEKMEIRFNDYQSVVKEFNDENIRSGYYKLSEYYPKISALYSQTNNQSDSMELFKHKTILHGDFHAGNLFFKDPNRTDPNLHDIVVCDWQVYGAGDPATEFVYFLNNVEFDPDRDLKLMKVYHSELLKRVPELSEQNYPLENFQTECDIRFMGYAMTFLNMIIRDDREKSEKRKQSLQKHNAEFFAESDKVGKQILSNTTQRFGYYSQKWIKDETFSKITNVN